MSRVQGTGLSGPDETWSFKILISDVQVREVGFRLPWEYTQELYLSVMSEGFLRIRARGKGDG